MNLPGHEVAAEPRLFVCEPGPIVVGDKYDSSQPLVCISKMDGLDECPANQRECSGLGFFRTLERRLPTISWQNLLDTLHTNFFSGFFFLSVF